MAQQAFRRKDDEWFAPLAQRLPPQEVEILRGRGGLDDLHVVLRREGEKPFQPRAGMFRSKALEPMRQQQHEAGQPTPFVFRAADELVENDLRGIDKIAELR